MVFWRRTLHLNTKIQSHSPLCKTTVLLSKLKKGEGKREKRICYTEDSSKWFLSISVVFYFLIFICIFLFINSPCEQRQGLAVLSSTTPWLSSKNRANHHDGHTGRKKKKSNHDSILGLSHVTTLKPAQIHCCRYHAWAKPSQWCCTWPQTLVEEKKKKRKAGLQVWYSNPFMTTWGVVVG